MDQTTTVEEYRRRFIELAFPLENVPEEIMRGQFINGLKEDIKAEICLLDPDTLEKAMDLATRIEERNRVNGGRETFGPWRSGPSQPNTSSSNSKGGLVSTYDIPNSSAPNNTNKSWPKVNESQASVNMGRPISNQTTKLSNEPRRLTESELQERRAKGLCFKCDERWGVGHRCKRKELSVLLVAGEPESEEEELEEEIDEENVGVSLCWVVGLTNPKTMKLKGVISGHEVIVMVDPGATHNFISLQVVEKARVRVDKKGEFAISLGNGESVREVGYVEE